MPCPITNKNLDVNVKTQQSYIIDMKSVRNVLRTFNLLLTSSVERRSITNFEIFWQESIENSNFQIGGRGINREIFPMQC